MQRLFWFASARGFESSCKILCFPVGSSQLAPAFVVFIIVLIIAQHRKSVVCVIIKYIHKICHHWIYFKIKKLLLLFKLFLINPPPPQTLALFIDVPVIPLISESVLVITFVQLPEISSSGLFHMRRLQLCRQKNISHQEDSCCNRKCRSPWRTAVCCGKYAARITDCNTFAFISKLIAFRFTDVTPEFETVQFAPPFTVLNIFPLCRRYIWDSYWQNKQNLYWSLCQCLRKLRKVCFTCFVNFSCVRSYPYIISGRIYRI